MPLNPLYIFPALCAALGMHLTTRFAASYYFLCFSSLFYYRYICVWLTCLLLLPNLQVTGKMCELWAGYCADHRPVFTANLNIDYK